MSNSEYRMFLVDRIERAYSGKSGPLLGFAVVDVTPELRKPESGFFQKILSIVSDESKFGINKIKGYLEAAGQDIPDSGSIVASLTLKDQHRSFDQQKHFQRIEGIFTKQAAKALVAQSEIVDLHVLSADYPGLSHLPRVDFQTGRVMPRRVKKHDAKDFAHAGLYGDLMKQFETSKTALVRVTLRRPAEYAPAKLASKEEQEFGIALVEKFLREWDDYEFQVVHKSGFYFYILTTKAHVKAMMADDRVEYLSDGSAPFAPTVLPELKREPKMAVR